MRRSKTHLKPFFPPRLSLLMRCFRKQARVEFAVKYQEMTSAIINNQHWNLKHHVALRTVTTLLLRHLCCSTVSRVRFTIAYVGKRIGFSKSPLLHTVDTYRSLGVELSYSFPKTRHQNGVGPCDEHAVSHRALRQLTWDRECRARIHLKFVKC